MNPHDQAEFCEIICLSFTEQEIELLEDFADYHFALVKRGMLFKMEDHLILDVLEEYEKEDTE